MGKTMKIVKAELSEYGRLGRDLTAECPECKAIDGYMSTGEHTDKGNDTVKCSYCGAEFKITWGQNG